MTRRLKRRSTASQALYQLSYAPERSRQVSSRWPGPWIGTRSDGPLRRLPTAGHGITHRWSPLPEQRGKRFRSCHPITVVADKVHHVVSDLPP